MSKLILIYLLKLFNVVISLSIFVGPGLYLDHIWPLCITWLFGLMTFSYLDETANKIENYESRK